MNIISNLNSVTKYFQSAHILYIRLLQKPEQGWNPLTDIFNSVRI